MLYKVAWGFIHLITGVLESAYLCIDKLSSTKLKGSKDSHLFTLKPY